MSSETVTLVIPGRNCEQTIRPCLAAVDHMLDDPALRLEEIVFVDDGSNDDTPRIVQEEFPRVRYIRGRGAGPGAARNLGWQSAGTALVWFIDSDCVAEEDALGTLLPHMDDANVGGVSGSYGNMTDNSLLSCLIHEEIIQRHRSMPARVDFLATFNVLYRHEALQKVGGFDERYLKAQDAELSFRVMEAGYILHFELQSRVKHFHATKWSKYLKVQRQQGYWRVFLHLQHRNHSSGDSYSSIVDHMQPPLAMLILPSLLLLPFASLWMVPVLLVVLLFLAQLPMTFRLVGRLKQPRYLAYALMSFIRAFWRGVGMSAATLSVSLSGRQTKTQDAKGG